MTDPSNPCPYCGFKSVTLTCSGDVIETFLCLGPEAHEWTAEFTAEDTEPSPLIVIA